MTPNKKEDRTEVSWALFVAPGAIASGHSRIPAIAATETTRLFISKVAGETCLMVEDPSLTSPGLIPWGNVASFGLK